MGVKTVQKGVNVGPGPVAEITPLDVYKSRAPKYPMLSNYKPLSNGRSPGPSEYNKAGDNKLKTMNKSPAFSMRVRALKGGKTRDPGPANYNLMDYNPFDRSPTHRIAGKPNKPGCVGVYILPQDNC